MGRDAGKLVHSVETYGLIAAGGVVGATLRWGVSELIETTTFPWATLTVNIVGAALLAVVLHAGLAMTSTVSIAVGFCGGLTTFSTMALEVVELADEGRAAVAGIYVVLSLALGLVGYLVGRRLTIDRVHLDRPPT